MRPIIPAYGLCIAVMLWSYARTTLWVHVHYVVVSMVVTLIALLTLRALTD